MYRDTLVEPLSACTAEGEREKKKKKKEQKRDTPSVKARAHALDPRSDRFSFRAIPGTRLQRGDKSRADFSPIRIVRLLDARAEHRSHFLRYIHTYIHTYIRTYVELRNRLWDRSSSFTCTRFYLASFKKTRTIFLRRKKTFTYDGQSSRRCRRKKRRPGL